MKRKKIRSPRSLFPEVRQRMCTGKRRYRSQGDALDAAMVVGVERSRKAYLCPLCGHWHLSSAA